jgi:hypothetical protein
MASEYSVMMITTDEERDDLIPLEGLNVTGWKQLLHDLHKVGLQALTWDRFPLSIRARNALVHGQLQSVWDALPLTRKEVEKIPRAGGKVRQEVYETVKRETGILLENWRDK